MLAMGPLDVHRSCGRHRRQAGSYRTALILAFDDQREDVVTGDQFAQLVGDFHVPRHHALWNALRALFALIDFAFAGQARLDTLRFINPVGIGDTIQARLTCKRKIDQGKKSPQGIPQGVVAWDVEVTNQLGELVASYDILTLVVKREE